jgi:hypothetical protein
LTLGDKALAKFMLFETWLDLDTLGVSAETIDCEYYESFSNLDTISAAE